MTGVSKSGGGSFASRKTAITGVLVAALCASIVLLCAVRALADDGSHPGETMSPALSAPTEEAPEKELVQERTATSETVQIAGGMRETRIYQAPIHYRNGAGDWIPIKEGFKEVGDAVEDRGHSFDLELPEKLGSDPVLMDMGDEWVSLELVGQETESVDLIDGAAIYDSERDGIAFEYTTLPNGVKENIEIAGPSQPSTFQYELDTSAGLVPRLASDGSVQLRDGDRTVAAIPPPVLEDSAPSPVVAQAGDLRLDVGADGVWNLTVRADREWLTNPERVWPIRVDPSIVQTNVGGGCSIQIWKPVGYETDYVPNLCSGGTPYTHLKWAAAYEKTLGSHVYTRGLLLFNLSAIPPHSFVRNAAVGLYSESNASYMPTAVQLRQITSNWNVPDWYNASGLLIGSAKWATPGGDFSGAGAEVKTTAAPAVGWWGFEGLGPIVRDWVSGKAANHGLLAKVTDEANPCTEDCWRTFSWASSQHPEVWKRPYLSVEYSPPAPSTSKLVSPQEGTRTARRIKLKSKWASAGVTGVTYQFREGNTGGFQTIPPGLVIRGDGQSVGKWPSAVSGFESPPLYFDAAHATSTLQKKGGPIQVRAVFEGPAEVEGYSAPVEAVVNRFTGAPKDAETEVGPGSVDLLTGNFSVSRTDVSIPGANSSLEFARSLNSRGLAPAGSAAQAEENRSVLGAGWKPAVPVEEAGGSEWSNLKIVSFNGVTEEGQTYSFEYAVLTAAAEGGEVAFEKTGAGYVTPPEMAGWNLSMEGPKFVLADPLGNRTTFDNLGSGAEYVPTAISVPGGSTNTTRVEYELKEGRKRVHMVVAPAPPNVSCISEAEATNNPGCRALIFSYAPATSWGAPSTYGDRLSKITLHTPGNGGSREVARYGYNASGRLAEEWDPRISPALPEKYGYTAGGQLSTLTPAGVLPWIFEYGAIDQEEANGRLTVVKRGSLLGMWAQTTLAYEVPVFGAGAPYQMSGASLAYWGQQDVPTDATAVFPATEVPSVPPASYAQATIYYMDAEGFAVNIASPKGAGTSQPSISTTEYDEFGNVVRTLSAQNRLRSVAEPEANRAARSRELDTQRLYSADGTQMEEEWGPMHQVRVDSGASVKGRYHRVVQYDKDWPGTGTKPHLPTRETSGVLVGGEVLDSRVKEMRYNWALRKPEESVVEPQGLKIKTVTVYDSVSGLPVETRQPKDAESPVRGPGATKIVYYSATGSGECGGQPRYANLPCKVFPAAQTSGAGRPELLVKKFAAYSYLGQPTEVIESPGGAPGGRKVLTTYDERGRQIGQQYEGGGVPLPKVRTGYSAATGLPEIQEFVCGGGECNPETVRVTYDALGRITKYEDADGGVATATYDVQGRPVTTANQKGSQTRVYDSVSGLLTEVQDSAAGTFTASYDANGNVTREVLPNGLAADTTYNETDEPVRLVYNKITNCASSCQWFDFSAERSIHGQVRLQTGKLSNQEFSYDKAGRLVLTKDTPVGGSCTTRAYIYDSNTNRVQKIVRAPGPGGVCVTGSEGSIQKYSYDDGDRLLAGGITYDDFGRTTSLPAEVAGGGVLTTSYFSNDAIASQSQGGVSNEFSLDAEGRQHIRTQAGGVSGPETLHFDDPSDAVSWTERGSQWTRNIPGIAGGIAAIQNSGSGTTLQLSNMHGDIVATASLSPTATGPTATFEFDEFGNPKSGAAGRYGWLGGKSRRTELASGVIQMGARSYIAALGRFLSPDPIAGGSANPYEYANGDPVNQFDLNGQAAKKKKKQMKGGTGRANRVECFCGGAQVTIPDVFNPVKKALGSFTAKVLTVGWNEIKREIETAKDRARWAALTLPQVIRKVNEWENKVLGPFAPPNLETRLSCTIGALGAIGTVAPGAPTSFLTVSMAQNCIKEVGDIPD